MASVGVMNEQPKSLIRPKSWSTEVENAYRFQIAGYRDEIEYKALRKCSDVWITKYT